MQFQHLEGVGSGLTVLNSLFVITLVMSYLYLYLYLYLHLHLLLYLYFIVFVFCISIGANSANSLCPPPDYTGNEQWSNAELSCLSNVIKCYNINRIEFKVKTTTKKRIHFPQIPVLEKN